MIRWFWVFGKSSVGIYWLWIKIKQPKISRVSVTSPVRKLILLRCLRQCTRDVSAFRTLGVDGCHLTNYLHIYIYMYNIFYNIYIYILYIIYIYSIYNIYIYMYNIFYNIYIYMYSVMYIYNVVWCSVYIYKWSLKTWSSYSGYYSDEIGSHTAGLWGDTPCLQWRDGFHCGGLKRTGRTETQIRRWKKHLRYNIAVYNQHYPLRLWVVSTRPGLVEEIKLYCWKNYISRKTTTPQTLVFRFL